MMPTRVKMLFDHKYHGMLTGHHGAAQVGPEEGALTAYDMVLGGLGACLNHTFQTVLDKKRLSFESVNYDIEGIKRKDAPTTLKTVTLTITLKGIDADKETQYRKAMEVAAKHCSVYATIGEVADMSFTMHFK